VLDWILALVMVIACAAGANAALRFARKKRRRASGKLPAGEAPVLQQVDIPSRVYVDRTVLAGPVAGKINNMAADIILTEKRLVVSTHQGKLLEITPQTEGSVRCTGPGRLVIEGSKPRADGEILVRVEALVATAETWSQRSAELLGTRRSAIPGAPRV
jgi:hypothetical protein